MERGRGLHKIQSSEKRNWFVENNDPVLNRMFQVIGQYFQKDFLTSRSVILNCLPEKDR